MQDLVQARGNSGNLGEPIHMPVKGLKKHDIHIRKGQLTMVAAAPGLGKTAIIQAILHHGDGPKAKNSVLYFSADSGPEVMYERAGALSMRLDTQSVREMVESGNTAQVDAAIKARHGHISYVFTSNPSQAQIMAELEAYVDLHGRFPDVVVQDNVKDLVPTDDPDEFRALEDAAVFLKNLARDAGIAVIGLHHVGGAYENGMTPVGQDGIRGKIAKTPALIFTFYKDVEGTYRWCTVKNRSGKADAAANFWIPLAVDLARMEVTG